jgi:pSer/pThr/pTyr-binding forkhead associated (FHA) protein
MHAKLVMLQKEQRTREIPLKGKEIVLGRQKGCSIRIASHEISRLHCCLRVKDQKVSIRDLGSANGTFVNGQQVKGERLLLHGDRIQLGELVFLVEYERGKEVLAGLPVDEFEYVGEVVQEVKVLGEPQVKSRPRAAASRPSTPTPPPSRPRRIDTPALPVEEEALDALPAADVIDSAAKPVSSSALPTAEVEQSGLPLAQSRSPATAPVTPGTANDFEVPMEALEDASDDQHQPLDTSR